MRKSGRMTAGLPEGTVCEIFVLDYSGDLYDKKISFKMGNYIRGPKKFSSPEELKEQLKKDILVAKHLTSARAKKWFYFPQKTP